VLNRKLITLKSRTNHSRSVGVHAEKTINTINMFSGLDKYKNNGHFFFEKDKNLKELSKDVPNLPGVYYILRLSRGKIDLVYIGKSGTILQNGSFKEQGLKGRLNNKQEGIKREDFFNEK